MYHNDLSVVISRKLSFFNVPCRFLSSVIPSVPWSLLYIIAERENTYNILADQAMQNYAESTKI